jgi:transposase
MKLTFIFYYSIIRTIKEYKVSMCYDAVRLRLEGRSYVEITKILDLTYQTVSIYVKSHKESGAADLTLKENKECP